MGARFVLLTRGVAVTLLFLAGSGCTSSAPELPPDYGSINTTTTLRADQFESRDLAMNCGQIGQQQSQVTQDLATATRTIEASAGHNAKVSHSMVFLSPAAVVALKQNRREKAQLTNLQLRWDALIALRKLKNC